MGDGNRIHTIGYGARSVPELADALDAFGIRYVVDVRSAPYSRFKQEFSREPLAAQLDRRGLCYVFMGDSLGGRPADPDCYDEDGHVDYERLRLRPAFREGLERLCGGWREGHRLALMCSEGKPQDCHRTKLIAEELVARGVPVAHIDERSRLREHAEVMELITAGQGTLFGDHAATTRSRKQYRVA
jgi:uncharacterized protein (DUF488 family)